LVVLAGVLAYSNSFQGAFVFDDEHAIVRNPYVRRLWPITQAISAPPQSSVAGRPTVSLSLAINYAVSGLNRWSYHAFNLAVHLLAGLALSGVVRRTLLREPLSRTYADKAGLLAAIIAVFWVVHPLQTESVTYVIQRAESMMGLSYLLMLYCMIRGAAAGRPIGWYLAAVLACGLGMATKEAMAPAPLVVLLYDRAFLAKSFSAALRRRLGLYVGLAATWSIVVIIMAAGPRSLTAGFGIINATPFEYARTQPSVILHYLRLCFWPHPLCLEYGWPVAKDLGVILSSSSVIAICVFAAGWGLWRNTAAGFLGAAFFLTLGPTSSFIPIRDLAFEHRMYVPLAAVVGLVVLTCDHVLSIGRRRLAIPTPAYRAVLGVAALAVTGLAGHATFQRNKDYASPVAMWQDVSNQRPANLRARADLAQALFEAGRSQEALEVCRQVLQVRPDQAETHETVGLILMSQGRYEEAIEHLRRAAQEMPWFARARINLALALWSVGRVEEAIVEGTEGVRLEPSSAEGHNNLGLALWRAKRNDEAMVHFREAARLRPDMPEAYYNIGRVLCDEAKFAESIEPFATAVRLNPQYADALYCLGAAQLQLGQKAEAVKRFQEALRINPAHSGAQWQLRAINSPQGTTIAPSAPGRSDPRQ
jgi:tetratricopeptide (TPR) repeat protein